MSGQEYQSVNDALTEVREGQKELLQAFNDFKVEISREYVLKSDCTKCEDHNGNSHTNLRNWIIGVYVALIGMCATIIALLPGIIKKG